MLPLDSILFWFLASVGVVMTGVSKSGFAGGAGVIAVPILALIIPVPLAAALLLPLLIVMDAKTVGLYWRSLSSPASLITITSSAIVGITIAGVAMASLPAQTLQIILGAFCVIFASWEKLSPVLGKLPGAAYLWGLISGISSTLLHAGGPPISIYFLSRNISKAEWLAQAAVFFAIMNLIKLIPFAIAGRFDTTLLLTAMALTPFALLGVKLGHLMQSRISQAAFTRFCRLLLLVSGVFLLLGV